LTNGTNGLRALNGGVSEALDSMTVDLCLAFCKTNGYSFAGLEYTRFVALVFPFSWCCVLEINNYSSGPFSAVEM
jgi:hypothetical protein